MLFPVALACLLSVEGRTRNLAQDGIEGPPRPALSHSTAGSDSSATALFVPVILKAAGRNASFFTSELTLTNRGNQPARLHYTYTAHAGGGSGAAAETLAAGRQTIVPDAIEHLRSLGVPLPESGNRIGTLRVEVEGSLQVGVTTRTTTAVPDGRAGLAYPGIAASDGFEEAVWLCGLRQNAQDRSNVAFQNLGTPEQGGITLRTTVYSGAGNAGASVLEEVRLGPGGFHQFSGVLGSVSNGYVKVERVEGSAPFYAYGVINDNFNSDGSFVFPVRESSLAGRSRQTLPVIIETGRFSSELTVTNFSAREKVIRFSFEAGQHTARFSLRLRAGRQRILPRIVDWMRRQGVKGIGPANRAYVGALFARVDEGDMSGIVVGARTGSPDPRGGQYGLFYNGVPDGMAWTDSAWIYGLQQNGENRSNLALVNTGEEDGSDGVFELEIYDGATGTLANTVTARVAAGGWHQINAILGTHAPGVTQGYVRVSRRSGANPFLAYGVINDGGAPGERSGDGAYLPAAGTILDREAEPMTDREVLEVLFRAAGGPEWRSRTHWLSDRPLAEWYGVETDENGRVTRLDLSGNGLSGPIPPALGKLVYLERLSLASRWDPGSQESLFNQLTGPIPPELGDLANLENLSLSGNLLSGPIPPELDRLANLRYLVLSANLLSGMIPPELGKLTNLQDLYLSSNRLTGPIPKELRQLPKLRTFSLQASYVCLPADAAFRAWLGGLANFQPSGLVCDGTRRVQFSAPIYQAREGGSVTVLVSLIHQSEEPLQTAEIALTAAGKDGATEADYSGVPDRVTLTAPATEVEFVFRAVEDDRFDPGETVVLGLGRPLPAGVTAGDRETATVRIIDSGTAARTDREVLEAIYHLAGGPEWSDRTHWLSDLPLADWFGVDADENGRVTRLDLSGNGLSGPIPPVLGKLVYLEQLDLGFRWDPASQKSFYNRLTGPIPPELGALDNLQRLDLESNRLTGPIPPELVGLANLRYLLLSSNQLTGPIPPELSALDNLYTLWLGDNQLSGPIPPELGELTSLRYLVLSGNQLTGPIPPELGALDNLQWLFLSSKWWESTKDQLSGPIPPELGELTNLRYLVLSGNQLTGPIPPELGALDNLQRLELGNNGLSGPIPSELGELANLQRLTLRSNRFSGPIPPELGGLVNLEVLHLGFNPDLTAVNPSWLQELPLRTLNLAATRVCIPEGAAFQEWLGTVEFTSSGLACGRPVPAMSSIDVAVFYTAGAREKAGGTAAAEAEIDLMVAETNRAYEESGVSQRIVLAAREEVEYTESGSGRTDLDRLSDPSDGHMDQVHAIRDREGADLVHLISQITDVGGVASAVFSAFAVTRAWYAGGFMHELGHNMGLSHDRGAEVYGYGSGLLPYSYGYVNQRAFVAGAPNSARWHTTMAYNDQCRAAGFSCAWVPRFSNPDQTWLGDPLGAPGEERTAAVVGPADAARALNLTRHSVAALRPRSSQNPTSLSSPLSQVRPVVRTAQAAVPVPAGDLFRAVAPSVRVRGAALHAGRNAGEGPVLRRRQVGVDLGMLARLPAGGRGALRLNLFDDVILTGIIERRTPTFSGGYALSGRLAGVPGGTVTLVVNRSVVAGAVRGPGAHYRIRPAERGRHVIQQIDPSQSSWTCGTGQRPQ